MGTVVVKRGRAKPLWKGHPWVFRDSVGKIEGSPEPGDLVTVEDEGGRAIGCGLFSPQSKIVVRLFGPEPPDLSARLAVAIRLRRETLELPVCTDGYRLVHAEGDGLPGLIVDYFAGVVVVQFSTVGMHRRREAILDALEEQLEPKAIFERPDAHACRLEGFDTSPGRLRGAPLDEPPEILEHGVHFRIALGRGQKTGFFCDQRDNRRFLSGLVRDRSVLDLFTYTGGFGLYAAANGAAEVLGIDSSGAALALAAENAMLNNGRQVRFERADARDTLNVLSRQKRCFDLVVCDPPKFARKREGVPKALRAYRDLHLRALRVVRPGGLLAVSSCSGLVSESDFENTVREASYDIGRNVQVLHRGGQAPDHPVLVTYPEGRYLKFLVVSVA